MTTQELIEKVEEILFKHGKILSGQLVERDLLQDVGLVYNMAPQLLATIKKYREALENIYYHQSFVMRGIYQGHSTTATMDGLSTIATIAKKALED